MVAVLGWLGSPVALLMTLAGLGGIGAWLIGSARLLFVGGLDRYLPPVFGKTHPRWKTPHVALLLQATLWGLFILAATQAVLVVFAAIGHPVNKLDLSRARLLALLTILIVLGVSAISYRYLEVPARRLVLRSIQSGAGGRRGRSVLRSMTDRFSERRVH